MVKHVDQSSKGLKMFAGLNIFNPEQFTIVSTGNFSVFDFHFKVYVLAESHAWDLFWGDESLNEICICTDTNIKNAQSTSLNSLKNGQEMKRFYTPFNYTFKKSSLTKSEVFDRYDHLSGLSHNGNVFLLEHEFPPKTQDKSMLEPKTTICVKGKTKTSCEIETIHTYPEEELPGVNTFSYITLD